MHAMKKCICKSCTGMNYSAVGHGFEQYMRYDAYLSRSSYKIRNLFCLINKKTWPEALREPTLSHFSMGPESAFASSVIS